ncbi:hypothetical protein [Anaerocolumna sp. MB42-C2]|uniref:hypothetical protein n=1 Tax=Anaerocolumna sp. MB42-C2 TaxID=3070997 RepID=UPI0027DF93C5|nr:hypothetical protein [Anaerocolumna sp. MB42-C2]WMJ87134.1 hypothetical protein RBU59_24350 [Anaerocolumna sp. MB42-C2]
MEYQYGNDKNYEDFASGRVLHNYKGITNFPARLAQEIFGRCLKYSHKKSDICLYDCCCGGGYMLTVLGFMNVQIISEIIGSDINPDAVYKAQNNLELLHTDGLNKRMEQIRELSREYGKESHEEALQSAIKLHKKLEGSNIITRVFTANVFENLILNKTPDIIITDVPYGEIVTWEGADNGNIDLLLDSLYSICNNETVIGICMDKSQKNTNDKFQRLEKQQIGKRRFEILKRR